jgi:hypothetical protein
MHQILIAATLACLPGHRLVDWSNRIARGVEFADAIVTLEPFYTRLLIYPVGHPENIQRCCNGRPVSVLRVPVGGGRFCIGQSQPQMKWKMRFTLKPGVES